METMVDAANRAMIGMRVERGRIGRSAETFLPMELV